MAITKDQIRTLYKLAAVQGLVESNNKRDNFHLLVERVTGKGSVSSLTDKDFASVRRELLSLMRYDSRTAPLKRCPKPERTAPGRITADQQSIAWRMIYRLAELDPVPSTATPGERMCGAIKKILGISAGLKDPFAWVTSEQGQTLIEYLKRYVRSAEKKMKAGATHGQEPAAKSQSG